MPKPLRDVTARRCDGCRRRFTAKRRDARYCSDACRQHAFRDRAKTDTIERRYAEAYAKYWALVDEVSDAGGLCNGGLIVWGRKHLSDLDR